MTNMDIYQIRDNFLSIVYKFPKLAEYVYICIGRISKQYTRGRINLALIQKFGIL